MRDVEESLRLIDGGYENQLGQRVSDYKTSYVREIIESLGISEEEWWDLLEENR